MTFAAPERWSRIEAVFAEAIELDAPSRSALLEKSCSGDADLRRELERLLAAHDAASDFLDTLDTGAAAALLETPSVEETRPTTVGPYQIVRRLGGGGMGVVYLAHDPRLDRAVALKLIRPEVVFRRRAMQRLMDEARAASALDHPHIAPIYEIGETADGSVFIAMAYCEGESLAERIARGPLDPADVAELGRQVAEGLAAAHRLGIVHCDVKPANILISPDGRARLLDFGIARVAGREARSNTPLTGTPAYMSPEQTRGVDVDHLSDVWSLGVVLFEALTGRRPFTGETISSLIENIRTSRPPAVSTLSPRAPRELTQLIDQCLAPEPTGRPSGAGAVAAALNDHLTSRSPRPRRVGRRLSSRTALMGGTLVLAAVAVAVASTRRRASTAATDADRLVVFPFAPVAPDSALARLGRELVVTLGHTLDGAGGLRVVDPLTVLGLGPRDGAPELTNAAALAARLGAAQMVHGRLSRSGTGVRLDATVYGVKDLSPIARASAEAPADDLTAITDALTLDLLRRAWRGRTGPAPNVAAITTSSVAALHAYLEGELAIAGAQFRTAPEAFARAIRADSTFWFAYWRYMYARSYHGQPVDSAVVAAVQAHHDGFPEPDRLLAGVRFTRGQRARLDIRRDITTRFPTYWPAWFELGDQLTHHGALLGISSDEARAVLRRVVELNPRFVPAWEHLFWLSVLHRDTAATAGALGSFVAQRLDTLAEWGPHETLEYYRYLDHLVRSAGEPDSASAEIGARVLGAFNGPIEPERTAVTLTNYGFHRAQVDLSRRVLRSGAPPRVTSAHTWGLALAWAGRGAMDSAFAMARAYARTTTNPRGALMAYGLVTTAAWLGMLPPDSAVTLREAARTSERGRSPVGADEIAWLDGLLACTRGQPEALRREQALLAGSSEPGARALAQSLAAFDSAMSGHRDAAGRALAELEFRIANGAWAFGLGAVHPYMNIVNRISAGRWLLAAGDTAEATKLWLLQESDLPQTIHPMPTAGLVFGTFALPELARVEMARGNHTAGRRLVALFRERTDLADPNWNPLATMQVCGRVDTAQ